jgi:tetratricopeptide (TPR) repeat protein
MSSAQKAAFETALVEDFDSIQAILAKVDVRTATCLKEKDRKAIRDELEQGVGFVACNTLVLGLLREALVAQAQAALARLPAAKRGTSVLLNRLGLLLQKMGKQEEARPLYEEALQARRATLGDRHPSTLISLNNMGGLLQDMGKLKEARPLLEEALQTCRETLGDRHPSTLASLSATWPGCCRTWASWRRRGRCSRRTCRRAGRRWATATRRRCARSATWAGCCRTWASGRRRGRCARRRCRRAQGDAVGDRHPDTLVSIISMAVLLKDMGKLEEARPLCEEAVQAGKDTLGDRATHTR